MISILITAFIYSFISSIRRVRNNRRDFKKNQEHLLRASELRQAFEDTQDPVYLSYAQEELNKIKV